MTGNGGGGNPGGGIPLTGDQNAILAAHNTYRQTCGVPNLVWDAALAANAQNWANGCHTNAKGGFCHQFEPLSDCPGSPGTNPNGESTSFAKRTFQQGTGPIQSVLPGQNPSDAVKGWYCLVLRGEAFSLRRRVRPQRLHWNRHRPLHASGLEKHDAGRMRLAHLPGTGPAEPHGYALGLRIRACRQRQYTAADPGQRVEVLSPATVRSAANLGRIHRRRRDEPRPGAYSKCRADVYLAARG